MIEYFLWTMLKKKWLRDLKHISRSNSVFEDFRTQRLSNAMKTFLFSCSFLAVLLGFIQGKFFITQIRWYCKEGPTEC